MRPLEIQAIGEEVNASVLELPGRVFPGLLLQGDSLSILCAHARSLRAALNEGRIDDARESADELTELLDGYRTAYERAMTREGLSLPYVRPSDP